MKVKYILLCLLMSFCFTAFAQYDALQINMEITRPTKDIHVRFSLYEDSLYYLTIKYNPHIDNKIPETWGKRDADIIIEIDKKDFDEISERSINLSSEQIVKGIDHMKKIESDDEVRVNFEFAVSTHRLSYDITNARIETRERNLEQFLLICDSIIRLADKNPEDYY